MTDSKSQLTLFCLLLFALLVWAPTATASGPYLTEPGFWWNFRPGIDPDEFAAGEPVVLAPTFEPAYLYAAYRRLSGRPAPAAEQFEALLDLAGEGAVRSNERDRPSEAISRWREAREQVINAVEGGNAPEARRPYPWVFRERPSAQNPETVDYLSFLNCHADAFDTAVETLTARVAENGANSAVVGRWLVAQDRVFAACSEREPPPASANSSAFQPSPDADRQEIHDREYQEAAEHFYLGRYEAAVDAFTLISRDASSPWRPIAALLVGRSHIRQATVGTGVDPLAAFARALVALDEVIARPELDAVHASARRLRQFVLLRTDPVGSAQQLETALLAQHPTTADRQALIDLAWLVSKLDLAGAEATSDEFGLWLWCLRSASSRPAEALRASARRWRETRALPWLVATGLIAASAEVDVGPWSSEDVMELTHEWLEATRPFDQADLTALDAGEAWALPSLLYSRAQLLARTERLDELYATLDQAATIFGERLSTSDANRFADLRVAFARDLDEFLEAAQRIPVTDVFNPDTRSGEWPIHSPDDGLPERLLMPSATRIFDRWLPLALQVEIVTGERRADLSPAVRDAIERAAWARAAALDQGAPAIDLALAAVDDESIGVDSSDFARLATSYLEIDGTDARRIVRLLSIIERPWSTPSVGAAQARRDRLGERDSFRRNWWCAFDHDDASSPDEAPPFLTTAQATAGLAEEETLTAIGDGQVTIGWELIGWADRDWKQNGDDPRVPEALHRIVVATRYAHCTGTDANEILSRAAFQRLHERYPDSEWTEATPYWYR